MPRAGRKKIDRYSLEFKLTAAKLSEMASRSIRIRLIRGSIKAA